MEKTTFLKAMGDTPVNRVLDFLATFKPYDYSMTDIAKNAGIGYTTLHQIWPKLEERGFVKQTRIIGKAKLYTLNLDSPAVKYFLKMRWEIMKSETHKLLGVKEQKSKKKILVSA